MPLFQSILFLKKLAHKHYGAQNVTSPNRRPQKSFRSNNTYRLSVPFYQIWVIFLKSEIEILKKHSLQMIGFIHNLVTTTKTTTEISLERSVMG